MALPSLWQGFNPEIGTRFAPAKRERRELVVCDSQGKIVRTLLDDVQPAGSQEVMWNGRNDGGRSVPTEVYSVRFHADSVVRTQKLVLLR